MTFSAAGLRIIPIELARANDLVKRLHRHHKAVQGHRFSLGIIDGTGRVIGAAIVGRPTARRTNQQEVLEVTRLVTDGTPNACSALYAAAARVGKEMGYSRIQTFILDSEPGTSLKAAGWCLAGASSGGDRNRTHRIRRRDQPIGPKQRWVKDLAPSREATAPLTTFAGADA